VLVRVAEADRAGVADLRRLVVNPTGEVPISLSSVADIAVNDIQISSIEATGSFSLTEDWLPDQTTGRVDLGFVSLPTLGIRTTMLFIRQKGELFTFTGSAMVDAGTKRLVGLHALPLYTVNWNPWVWFQPKVLRGSQARHVLRRLTRNSWRYNTRLGLRARPDRVVFDL